MSSFVPSFDSQDARIRNDSEAGGSRKTGRRQSAKRGSKPWLRWIAMSVAIIAGLTWYLAGQNEPDTVPAPPAEPATLVAPPRPWEQVINPAVLFTFDFPELNLPPMTVEARNYREGGREDALAIGTPGNPFYLRVVVDRSNHTGKPSFYLDLVRTAADAGLAVRRSAQATESRTKFGSMEIAQATLAKSEETNCLAFRSGTTGNDLQLRGWLCGDQRYVDENVLACFIDRLTVTPALRERSLEDFLRASNQNRTVACETAMNAITAAD